MKSRIMWSSVARTGADGDRVATLRHGNETGDARACAWEMGMSGATGLTAAGGGARRPSVLRTAIAANIGAVFEWQGIRIWRISADLDLRRGI
jgi:hypothetical protein